MIKVDETKKAALLRAALTPLSQYQFKKCLSDNALLDIVNTKISAIEDEATRTSVQFEFDNRPTFERNSPTIAYMQNLLEYTDEVIDALWKQALTL